MADAFKPLFNRNLLKNRIKGFEVELSDAQRKLVEDWAKTASDPMFRREKEKPFQGQFLKHIFGTAPGYTHAVGHLDAHHLKAETASKKTKGGKTPDGILGYYGNDADHTTYYAFYRRVRLKFFRQLVRDNPCKEIQQGQPGIECDPGRADRSVRPGQADPSMRPAFVVFLVASPTRVYVLRQGVNMGSL